MSGFVAADDALVTSNSGFKCNGEVGGDGEGELLSEWYFGLDLLAIHSLALLAPNMLKAPKIGSTTRGIPARSGPWLVAPIRLV